MSQPGRTQTRGPRGMRAAVQTERLQKGDVVVIAAEHPPGVGHRRTEGELGEVMKDSDRAAVQVKCGETPHLLYYYLHTVALLGRGQLDD